MYSLRIAPRSAKQIPQFFFGLFESLALGLRQIFSCPVDVEVQHRHGGAERIGLAALAVFSGLLERFGNPPRVVVGEYARFEIQRIAALGNPLRPFG